MSRSLPQRPSLEQLHKQAKDVLKAHRAGNASACSTLRCLRQFAAAGDAEILAAKVGLQEVQFALAMEYGYADWAQLAAHVAAGQKGSRVIVSNVDRYRVVEPLFEGVRVILTHRGEKYSPAYIQGISGAAFRVAGICPCAPTCSVAMGTTDLIKLLGYSYTEFPLGSTKDEAAARMQELLPGIKDSIRSGRPVLAWHAFTNAEWDVAAGFDDKAHQLLGRGSYAGLDELAKAKETRPQEAIDICPAFGAVFIGERTGKFDDKAAELGALKEAVRHARDQANVDKQGGTEWVMLQGLAAYGRWVDHFRKNDAKKGAGDSYCVNVYRSTHRAGSEFLAEIASGYPKAAGCLRAAAKAMSAEADALDSAEPLIGRKSPELDAARNAKVWPILAEAAEQYATAIAEIEKAVGLMT